jgi:hypothetical protein
VNPLHWFTVASWISLPTVMFGGYSLLSLLRKQKLTPEQVTLFRAGHAHAGVLLLMSLLYYGAMATTRVPAALQISASATLLVGILLQAGGFFWHAFVDRGEGAKATGARITSAGAVLLVVAVVVLVYGLIASPG